MNEKRLSLLAFAAVAMVILTVLVYHAGSGASGGAAPGAPLIQGFDPGRIGSLIITGQDGKTVTLTRASDGAGGAAAQGDRFVIEERKGYPASIEKINNLIREVADIRVKEEITSDPAKHEGFGLTEGHAEAITVAFRDKEGKPLVGIVRGQEPAQGGGRYVRKLDGNAVYISEKWFSPDAAPTDYFEKKILAVPRGTAVRADVRAPEESYTVAKGEGGAELKDAPAGKRGKKHELDSLLSALESFYVNDVVPAADLADVAWEKSYACTLETGLSYTVQLGVKGETSYAKLAAAPPPPARIEAAKEIAEGESEESMKKKSAVLDAIHAAEAFNARHAAWAYEISSWAAQKLAKPVADLLEDIPAPAEASKDEVVEMKEVKP